MSGKSGFFAGVDVFLLARAKRGEPAALEEIFRVFSGPVHNLGYRLCGSLEEAEEILQETFLEVIRSLAAFRGEAPFGAWLRRVAVSKVLSRRRRALVRKGEVGFGGNVDVLSEAAAVVEDRPSPGLRVDLERALVELDETSRIVLWLHDVEGMTHSEIGELLGRSPSFSKSRLSRAHARLREWLNEAWSNDDALESRTVVGAAGR